MLAPLHLLLLLLTVRLHDVRDRDRDDRGASVVEWVIITALLVGLAVLVAGVITQLVTSQSQKIQVD
ncbi:hypothetical protein [Nocardioides bruguierae]|uniref:Uncharacterized protein n=1 Tax=Nocardioides bruguierae TaxID=2945102 RepID=A0A9X2DAW1_9ACTN|nr:hypothetical protein [Nocardioides bruguierae]MCM0621269.1 hypothetical protein [Nocardioides bruguierae]